MRTPREIAISEVDLPTAKTLWNVETIEVSKKYLHKKDGMIGKISCIYRGRYNRERLAGRIGAELLHIIFKKMSEGGGNFVFPGNKCLTMFVIEEPYIEYNNFLGETVRRADLKFKIADGKYEDKYFIRTGSNNFKIRVDLLKDPNFNFPKTPFYYKEVLPYIINSFPSIKEAGLKRFCLHFLISLRNHIASGNSYLDLTKDLGKIKIGRKVFGGKYPKARDKKAANRRKSIRQQLEKFEKEIGYEAKKTR